MSLGDPSRVLHNAWVHRERTARARMCAFSLGTLVVACSARPSGYPAPGAEATDDGFPGFTGTGDAGDGIAETEQP